MINELSKICKIKEDLDLTLYNTFKLHSKCKVMCFISNKDELKSVLNVINKHKSKWFVIGNGSNIILPDYYDGVIIKLVGFDKYEIKDDILTVDSNCMINKISYKVSMLGFSGLDFAVGIPGTVGGCIYGNAGCYGSDISNVLISATIFDGKEIKELKNEDFKFSNRYSILKTNKNYIILSAKFKLTKSNKEELYNLILERNKKRTSSQDLHHPSNGSVFRNPLLAPAGKLIEDAGLKGTYVNDAMVSYKHANFIINNGNAKSEDIIKLIDIIKKEVKNKYDVDLVLEQEIIE